MSVREDLSARVYQHITQHSMLSRSTPWRGRPWTPIQNLFISSDAMSAVNINIKGLPVYPDGYRNSSSGKDCCNALLIFLNSLISPLCIHCWLISCLLALQGSVNSPSICRTSKDEHYLRLLNVSATLYSISLLWRRLTSTSTGWSSNMSENQGTADFLCQSSEISIAPSLNNERISIRCHHRISASLQERAI